MKTVFFCVDIGNSRTKWGLFEGDETIDVQSGNLLDPKDIHDIHQRYPSACCIISSTVNIGDDVAAAFRAFPRHIFLHQDTPVPFRNLYGTPATLGLDRMALAAAAASEFPGMDVLVMDAGTCITLDFVDRKGNYHGGSIHPGLQMRMRAMHQFTDRLPLIDAKPPQTAMGNDTASCMQAGGVMGAVMEMEGMINLYKSRYPGCRVVLTGGDGPLFFSLLKNEIFALPNFVLTGLLKIAQHNV